MQATKLMSGVASNLKNADIIFSQLKDLLMPYAGRLPVQENNPGDYMLVTTTRENKELFVAAVVIKKNYVSYHLMPVYMYPDLLKGISPALKQRMQGKSCFNFTAVDETLFQELKQLTARAMQRARTETAK